VISICESCSEPISHKEENAQALPAFKAAAGGRSPPSLVGGLPTPAHFEEQVNRPHLSACSWPGHHAFPNDIVGQQVSQRGRLAGGGARLHAQVRGPPDNRQPRPSTYTRPWR